jgi:hypothetical protein
MGFLKNSFDELMARIDKVLSNDWDKERKDQRLKELEHQAQMAMAAGRQYNSLQTLYKEKTPSISKRKVHNIIDSRRNQKLNKYSFSQQQQYEILDRRARLANGENVVYPKVEPTGGGMFGQDTGIELVNY